LFPNCPFCPHLEIPVCNQHHVVAILGKNNRPKEREKMPSNLLLIAVTILAAIIAVALLLRSVVRWLLGEWHAAKSRNYPNRLQ